MKLPVRFLLFLLCVTLGLSISAGPAAGQEEVDDPLLPDARQYAATYDVELDEALSRLRRQAVIGRLNAKLAEKEPATFAGLWVQHEPSYLIVVQFAGGGEARLQKLLRNEAFDELYPHVDVRTARRSLKALAAVQAASHQAAKAQGVPVESMINVRENRVDLRTTEVGQLTKSLQDADRMRKGAGALKLLDNVVIIEVDRLSVPVRYVYAGRQITACTSGFAVQDVNGTLGVLTAGHCPDGQAFNLRNLPFQAGQFSGSVDAQWHTAPELHVTNRIWDGLFDTSTPSYRFVTGTRPRSQQAVGEFVCKFGVTTGHNCGTIESTSFLPPSGPGLWVNPAATFIYVDGDRHGVDLSEPGDSGGPWFSGETAYGVMSGQSSNDAIYMAIDFISALGVSVLTTTPALNVGRFTFRNMGDNINAYTEINLNDYECGLAGFAARDGDIQEHNTGTILLSHLNSANNHFNFRGEFRTHNNSESWDFDLLCLQRSVYSVLRFSFNSLGDNVTANTGLSTTTYECGIGGMAALDGDINENNTGDPILAYMFRSGGQWWLRGEFRTHSNSESWNLDALCVDRAHPVSRFEFRNLGDNVNGFNTFISSSAYECGVAGISARDADIEEHNTGDIIQAFLFSSGGTWRIRADFRSHNNHETWDIDVLCIQR
jgi:hypothetical protein